MYMDFFQIYIFFHFTISLHSLDTFCSTDCWQLDWVHQLIQAAETESWAKHEKISVILSALEAQQNQQKRAR